jgi:hypothetical protein
VLRLDEEELEDGDVAPPQDGPADVQPGDELRHRADVLTSLGANVTKLFYYQRCGKISWSVCSWQVSLPANHKTRLEWLANKLECFFLASFLTNKP